MHYLQTRSYFSGHVCCLDVFAPSSLQAPSAICNGGPTHSRGKKFQKFPSHVTHAMSLYYETATILENPDKIGGSFKARIFKKKDLKSKPGQIYALVAEASKWSRILKDVIETCQVLKEERKVCLQSDRRSMELRIMTFTLQIPLAHLLTSTAHAHPRAPPHARPPPLQVWRRSTQRPRPTPRNRTPQSAPQRGVHKSSHPAQVPHPRSLPRSHQRRRP